MKKLVPFVVFAAAVIGSLSCSEDQKKSLVRTNFMSTCIKGLTQIDEKIAKEYCECSAEAIFNKYTMDEFAEIEKKMSSGSSDIAEFSKVFAPCVEEMTQKLEKASQISPAK